MKITSEKIHQLYIAAILLLFVVAVFLNFAFMDFVMAIDPDGLMSNCPFMANGSLCNMDFQDHLNALKLAFTALPQKVDFIKNLLLLTSLIIALAIYKNRILTYNNFLHSKHLIYARNADISIFNTIREAFSRGIINPKIF